MRITKARYFCEGRRDLFARMGRVISASDRVVWVHVSSLGEFEQGRTIMEKIREDYPQYKILLTFFSPSGYEVRKDYEGVDFVFYLPMDTSRNAVRFLDIVHPEVAIFVKYEYWFNLLFELRRRSVKTYIVSAIFRCNSPFFKWWGFMWRSALESFDTLFVQDENSRKLLSDIGFDNVVVAGDTRFDRVAQIAKSATQLSIIDRFKGGNRLVVAGSTWAPDEQVLGALVAQYSDLKFVIAPHEIADSRIAQLLSQFAGISVRYSVLEAIDDESEFARQLEGCRVLILDTMGLLSSLYQYGDWAYIGGGFGAGIHNTLEAATFALPIAFGANYQRFKEAVDMVSLGAACSVTNSDELLSWFAPLYSDSEHYAKVSAIAREYTAIKCGATNIVVRSIFDLPNH